MGAFTEHRFQSMLDQESNEYEAEIGETKMQSHQELKQQQQIEIKLKKEQEALLKGLEMMEKDRARVEKEQHEAEQTIFAVKAQSEELTRTVNSLKDERKERANTLRDKEMKIESYKVKVNTLKKFKHVLDESLLKVTESMQPKDRRIAQLNEHLRELEGEFERQLTEQRNIEATIEQKSQQIDVLTNEGREIEDAIKEKDRVITRFTQDVYNLVVENTDVKSWPSEIR